MTGYPPSVELTTLWERESARGTRYMSGYFGRAKVTLLPGDPTEDGTPTWRLLIQAAPPRQTEAGERSRSAPQPRRARRPASSSAATSAPSDSASPLPDDPVDDLYR